MRSASAIPSCVSTQCGVGSGACTTGSTSPRVLQTPQDRRRGRYRNRRRPCPVPTDRRNRHGGQQGGRAWSVRVDRADCAGLTARRRISQTMPRPGAKSSDTATAADAARTINGPVASPRPSAETSAPKTPDRHADQRRQDHHYLQPRTPLPCGDGGRDHHCRHQYDADHLQPDDDRERDHHGERDLQSQHRQAEGAGEDRIESDQLELFPEGDDDGERGEASRHP
jgi:hypothetical protein